MIYVAGISISLFISALLLNKKNKSKFDRILLVWMLLLAVHLFLFYVNFTPPFFRTPSLLGIEIPLPLIHGVLLYYYVAAVTRQFPKRTWLALLHLAPISIGYLLLIPIFYAAPSQKVVFYQNGFEGYELFMKLGLHLIFISGIIYVLWCSILLQKHKKNIRNQFSDLDDISLNWLQFLIYGLGVIWSIVIFTNNDVYIFAGVSVFVILIGFFGVQQRTIFTRPVPSTAAVNKGVDDKKKYERSGLKDEVAEAVYTKMMHLFREERYYKKNDLSLLELASDLEIHPNYLSQIINEREKKTFYELVNSFRLEEFKRMLSEEKHKQFTLLALAYECGFNSKSSFNRYFKKNTGKTPSQFVKALTASS
ncbi:MAG: AraC family transcriptional regulator [Bacteroidota bacterium]